jgi:hypothetical protein
LTWPNAPLPIATLTIWPPVYHAAGCCETK